MTPRQLKKRMKEQSRALRRQLRVSQKALRARVNAMPIVRQQRNRRRARQAVLLTILLLLLLLIRCDCGQGPATQAAQPPVVAEIVKPKLAPKPPPKPAPLRAKVNAQPRAKFNGDAPAAPPWLDEFRLQVAARSPRLAACFTGSDRPGALRWTAAVDAKSGVVADHLLEPIGTSGELDRTQHDCAVKALSAPVYRLTGDELPATPSRVSLVIEF